MPADKESIKVTFFDEKFKNLLRDYYSYGFGCLSNESGVKEATQDIDRERLSNIFRDDMKWENSGDKISLTTSRYSQEMDVNPFHKVYHFCKYKSEDSAFFFHTMAALSSQLCVGDDAYEILARNRECEGKTTKSGEDFLSEYEYMRKKDQKKKEYKTSDLINFYPKILEVKGKTANDNNINKKYNLKLQELSSLGIIRQTQRIGLKGKKGDRRWSIDGLPTMRRLLDEGKKANKDFEFHLQCLLDFYSKYYMFGEVGVFLLDRMENSSMSPFRLKHEHYMQALNDYNCIDLLYAIEQGKWCRIQYKHGMNGEKIELLCYPIEIRVGFRNGRESLVYYEPFQECYTTLRLEFIESICYCEDQDIRQALQKYDGRYTNQFIDMEIENARRSIKNSWGISTTVGQQKNAMTSAILHKVKMRIAFDPKMEGFIRRRLQRECRLGQVVVNETEGYIDFEVKVTDAGELIPWVRSFYCRIISCEGMPADRFEMKKDVEMMLQRIKPKYEEKRKELSNDTVSRLILQKDRWQIPNEIQTVFPKGTPAQTHSKIFHEIFSARYYIIAESLMQKYRYNMSGDSFAEEKRNKQIIRVAVRKCEKQMGENTGRNINGDVKALLEDPQYGFVIKKENSKESVNDRKHSEKYNFYELTGKILDVEEPTFYKDIIPLSEIEKRWLLSVLDDSKVDYFLNREEINAVKKSIQENVFTDKTFYNKAEHIHMEVLPMKYVKCFDQYYIQDNRQEKEYVMMLAKAIIDRKTVFIRYHTLTGKMKEGNYNPILLEFSKDHNRLQGYFEISKTNKIVIFNLSNIQNVEDTEEKFDIEQAKMNLQNYLNWQGLSTEIQFSDEKNTADRILTELAPWKKKCTYDKNSGIYQLKIDYQKSDQLDLVIRLMGYGSTIQFKKEDDPIYIEIKRRLECQLKHMAENECK